MTTPSVSTRAEQMPLVMLFGGIRDLSNRGYYYSRDAGGPFTGVVGPRSTLDLAPKRIAFDRRGTVASIFDEESIPDLIVSFASTSVYPAAMKLSFRLADLFEAANEEKLNIATGSLKQFLRFMEANPWLDYPDVGISAWGNIRSQWRKSSKQHLAIEFSPSGDVQFVVFSKNRKHHDQTVRISGYGTQDSIFELLDPFEVKSWCASG